MKEKYFLTTLFLLFSLCFGCHLTGGYGLKASLNNPTEYTFDASMDDIEKALAQLASERDLFEHGGVVESEVYDGYALIILKHSSPYYRRPEDGSGDLACNYDVEITQLQEDMLVRVVPRSVRQHTGEGYSLSPHPAKGMEWKEVETSTYWEYRLLLEIGNLVGQEGMPPIKE